MYSHSKYSAERAPGREHIPLYPRGFIALRIVQLVLSLIIIGLCGFGVVGFAALYLSDVGNPFMLFTVSRTNTSSSSSS
jgi:hypothetical protein